MNTLFGGVLVNVKALEHIDWKEVSKWYKNTKYLSFSYIRLYAEIAIRSPQFKALSIFAKDGIKWSKYKLDIGWRNDFFEVFYECFINVVNSFPISTKSQKYIIDSFYREDIMLNKSILEYMRTKGYFDINVLNKWKEYMEYAIPYAISKKVADIPREKLIEKIWGYEYFGDTRVIDAHMKNIRKKIKKDYIKTIKGVGYVLEK